MQYYKTPIIKVILTEEVWIAMHKIPSQGTIAVVGRVMLQSTSYDAMLCSFNVSS
jgi:hypothetical protein